MNRRADISLYVHVPFCTHLCGYCDFYKLPMQKEAASTFQASLLRELEGLCCKLEGSLLSTVYFGGGTPSLLPPPFFAGFGERLRRSFVLHPKFEWTVEANPETVSPSVAEGLASAGVNRVSLGVQSFDEKVNRFLQREHDLSHVDRAIAALRAAGIANLNLDLIFGVPGQSLASWEKSLDEALFRQPPHLSLYGLTFEKGTPLGNLHARGRISSADEELYRAHYLSAVDKLKSAGLFQYEISNFARPGFACRHNLRYWYCRDVYGLGPAAWSNVGGQRFLRFATLERYHPPESNAAGMLSQEPGETEPISEAEKLMLRLRCRGGVDLRRLVERTSSQKTLLDLWVREGLAEIKGRVFRLTPRGFLVSNELFAALLD